jgi:hypothetical protein
MDNLPATEIPLDSPVYYRIRVTGRILGDWSDRLEGMAVNQVESFKGILVTTLEGELADQAALTGVLNKLDELQLPVLYLECYRTVSNQKQLPDISRKR